MSLRTLVRQASRYLLTGGSAAVVDIGLFWCALRLGLPIWPSAVISFLLATVVNYLLTARIVFGHRPSLTQYFAFLPFALVGLLINSTLTWLFFHLGAPALLAKGAAIGVTFVANFAMNALIVFRKAPERPAGPSQS